MNHSHTRSTRRLAARGALTLLPLALLPLTLLSGCSTTVSGSGRPLAGTSGGSSSSSSSSSTSGGSSASPTATGTLDANGDAHDVWSQAIDATTGTDGSVLVSGVISGAGIGSAEIIAVYAMGEDDEPVATVGIDTPGGGHLDIITTGGSAWAKADASVYVEYGYPADASAEASGKEVLLTDDDSGLDVYADLETFLSICGPDDDDPASVDDGSYEGKDAIVVTDTEYNTDSYVDPVSGLILASVFQDETVTFTYKDSVEPPTAPADSEVVTVDGF